MMRSCVLLCLLLPTISSAASWSDFESAFPVFPCVDGWSACLSDGNQLNSDLKPGVEGALRRSTDRLAWDDLSATSSFDPFGELSGYEKRQEESDDAVAMVEVKPLEAVEAEVEHVDAQPELPEPGTDVEPELAEVEQVEPDKETKVVAEHTEVIEVVDVIEVIDPIIPEKVAVIVDCSDLIRLEVPAMMGSLGDDNIACLEAAMVTEPSQTTKRNMSILMIQNAWRTDKRSWEKLVKRHLKDIDQSDPDIAYSYAAFLGKKGPARASEVLRWSGVAMDNKTRWPPSIYSKRVYSLHKMRSRAANMLWKAASERYNTNHDDADRVASDKWQGKTKNEAREWYDYAHEAGKDTTNALQLCMSAAGHQDYCTGG